MCQSFTYIASNSLLFHECFLCSGFTKHEIKLRCIKLHYITFQNFSSLMVLYPGFTEHHITLHAITFQHITFTYITFHYLSSWMVLYPAFIEHFRRLLSREQVSELQNVISLLHRKSQIREGALFESKNYSFWLRRMRNCLT